MLSRENAQTALLENLSVEELISLLKLNGSDPKMMCIETDSIKMALMIADGMISGAAEDCPVCENASLCWCANRITCWGSLGGTTRCVFKTKGVKRFAYRMPKEIVQSPWMQGWLKKVTTHAVTLPEGETLEPVEHLKMDVDEIDPVKNVLQELTVKQLQIFLDLRGQDTTGKKEDLLERLTSSVSMKMQNNEKLNKLSKNVLEAEATLRGICLRDVASKKLLSKVSTARTRTLSLALRNVS
jgi:hypothetical protein